MFRKLEAKYLSEFRPNLLIFTQALGKSVCDLKLQLNFLVWKNVAHYIVWKISFNIKWFCS